MDTLSRSTRSLIYIFVACLLVQKVASLSPPRPKLPQRAGPLSSSLQRSPPTSDLLQEFAEDLSRLSALRPPLPAADFSTPTAIVSAGSSYTRLWTHETWRKHSESFPHARYARHLRRWRFSTTAHKVLPSCLLGAGWAWFVSMLFSPTAATSSLLKGASAALTALTAPLALLLTLRTNASFARLHETRLAWGRLVLYSRIMGAQIGAYMLPDFPEAALLMARLVCVYGWCLKASLRGEHRETLDPVLKTMLPPQDYEWLVAHPHPVWGISQRLRHIVRQVARNSTQDFWVGHSVLESSMEHLEGTAGTCERILGSPLPPTYSRHLSRVLTFWLSVLPLGLIGSGVPMVGTILATAFISYVMVGLDELGMEIEHPFPLLPLQQLAGASQEGVAMQLMDYRVGLGGSVNGAGLPGIPL